MKRKITKASDPSTAYRSLRTGRIDAPKKVKDAPRVTKTESAGDLRAPKRR